MKNINLKNIYTVYEYIVRDSYFKNIFQLESWNPAPKESKMLLMDSYRLFKRRRGLIGFVRSKLDPRVDTSMMPTELAWSRVRCWPYHFRGASATLSCETYMPEQTENCRAHTLLPGSVNITLRSIRLPRYNHEEDGPASEN